jgi:xylulokinase
VRILAIDLGTAAIRAGLFDGAGHLLGIERTPLHEPDGTGRGVAEQDPAAWWAAIVAMTRSLVAAHGRRVDAVCAVGHGPTCVPTDGAGHPTRAAITWRDHRTVQVAAELTSATGASGWGLGSLPATLWIARHDPVAAAATRWYLGTWEWLACRLSGAAGATARPADEVLAQASAIGLPVDAIPPAISTGSVVAGLAAGAAADLGVEAGVPVVAGTYDAAAGILGAGACEAGQAVDVGGAAGGFALVTDAPRAVGPYRPLPALVPGRWLIGGAMAATGSSLDWLVWSILGGTIDRDRLVGEADEVAPGADGLVFLPYLAGERAPFHDPDATGAFVGLTLLHHRAHLTRAVLEAAAFALRHVAEPIVSAGLAVAEMRVAGGPARSETWNRIKADVTGFPVVVPAIRETAMVGAGLLARAALDGAAIAELAATWVHVDHRLEPDPANRAVYDEAYRRYVALYPTLSAVAAGRS